MLELDQTPSDAGYVASINSFVCTLTASSAIFTSDMVHAPSAYGNINAAGLAHGDAIVFNTNG